MIMSASGMVALFLENKEGFYYDLEHQTFVKYGYENDGIWSQIQDEIVASEVDKFLINNNYACYGSNHIKDIVALLKVRLQVRKWPEKKHLIPFKDGVLDTKNNQFLDHNSKYYLTWCLPYNYNTEVTEWTTINNWLDEATDNNLSDKNKLLCFMAAVIRNRYDLQKYLHLIGNAGSGKGTFCKLLESLIGLNNTEGLRKQDLTDKEALSRAAVKPLVILDDLSPLNRGELDTFKSFTGEGKITCRQLYKKGFSTEFKGLSVVTSNHQIFNGLDTAITRRACPVWFNQVPKSPRDLMSEIKPEIPAFLKYLISIPVEHIENTLRENYGKITPNLWKCQIESDGLSSWINDHIIYDENSSVQIGCDGNQWSRYGDGNGDFDYDPSKSTLYGSYALYCKSTSRKALSKDKFSSELIRVCEQLDWTLEKKKDSKGLMCIHGVKLRGLSEQSPTVLEYLEAKEKAILTNKTATENIAINDSDLTNELDNNLVTESEVKTNNEPVINQDTDTTENDSDDYNFPTENETLEFSNNHKEFHIFDYVKAFWIIKDNDLFSHYVTKVSEHLQQYVDQGILIKDGSYYHVNPDYTPKPPKKKQREIIPLPSESAVFDTLKEINNYIDFTELSMGYFDGCDALKLRVILDTLVDRGLCEVNPLDDCQYKAI